MSDVFRYADMDDRALVRLLQDAGSDDDARSGAAREMERRGLAPPAAAAPVPGARPASAQFADNPYQPPQTVALETPPLDTPARGQRTRNLLWWIYIAVVLLMSLRAVYNLALGRIVVNQAGAMVLSAVWIVGAIGLVRWRLGRPPLLRFFWGLLAIALWLAVATMALGVVAWATMLLIKPVEGFPNPWIAMIGFGIFLFLAPMAWGLSKHAFRPQARL